MKEELGLTESQCQQFQGIVEKRRRERKDDMAALTTRVRGILTPEQQKIWDSRKESMGQMRSGASTGGGYESRQRRSANAGEGYESRQRRSAASTGGGYESRQRRSANAGEGYESRQRRSAASAGGYSESGKRMFRNDSMTGRKGANAGGRLQNGGMGDVIKELNLSEGQRNEIQSIMEEQKAKMQTVRKSMEDDLKGVLTPEQYKKLEEKKMR